MVRKGDGHFSWGLCPDGNSASYAEWQQQHRRVGCAAPPPLAAGMTPLCHTPVSLRPSLCLPGSRDHALRFSPAPRGKLAVHYIRNVNAGALGRLVPGGHAAAVASLLLGASVRPSPRLGEPRWARRDARRAGEPGSFLGKYRPFPPACGPPRRLARSPRPARCLPALACLGRREPPEPGCEGRDAVCALVCVCRLPCSGSSRAGGS